MSNILTKLFGGKRIEQHDELPVVGTSQSNVDVTLLSSEKQRPDAEELKEQFGVTDQSLADLLIERNKNMTGMASGILGYDEDSKPIPFEFNDHMPSALIVGGNGPERRIAVDNILLSMMDAGSPENLQMVPIDSNGSIFDEFGNNPFIMQTAKSKEEAGKLENINQKIVRVYEEVRERINLMENAKVSSIAKYNEKMDKHLPDILLVINDPSDLFDEEKLKPREESSMDCLEYIIKMGRAVHVYVLMTERGGDEYAENKVTANVACRVAMQLSDNPELKKVLRDDVSGVALKPDKHGHLLRMGEYIMKNGRLVHGWIPYVNNETVLKVNQQLTDKLNSESRLD